MTAEMKSRDGADRGTKGRRVLADRRTEVSRDGPAGPGNRPRRQRNGKSE